MSNCMAKSLIVIIALSTAFFATTNVNESAYKFAHSVILFFLATIPTLTVGCLLKYICCCKKD